MRYAFGVGQIGLRMIENFELAVEMLALPIATAMAVGALVDDATVRSRGRVTGCFNTTGSTAGVA